MLGLGTKSMGVSSFGTLLAGEKKNAPKAKKSAETAAPTKTGKAGKKAARPTRQEGVQDRHRIARRQPAAHVRKLLVEPIGTPKVQG
jgi:hypothetical protein